jgi:hypothetical protein
MKHTEISQLDGLALHGICNCCTDATLAKSNPQQPNSATHLEQRAALLWVSHVWVAASIQQHLDHRAAAEAHSLMQRRPAATQMGGKGHIKHVFDALNGQTPVAAGMRC